MNEYMCHAHNHLYSGWPYFRQREKLLTSFPGHTVTNNVIWSIIRYHYYVIMNEYKCRAQSIDCIQVHHIWGDEKNNPSVLLSAAVTNSVILSIIDDYMTYEYIHCTQTQLCTISAKHHLIILYSNTISIIEIMCNCLHVYNIYYYASSHARKPPHWWQHK